MVHGWPEIDDIPSPLTQRVNLLWEWGRIVGFGFIILPIKFQLLIMPRRGLKVPGGWVVGGGGVESKFSVQLRPKLNNFLVIQHSSIII